MLAKDINFTKGLEFNAYVTSDYGQEYDKIKKFEVLGTRNYKSRGQKLQLRDMDLGYQCGMWVEEYPHKISLI